MGFRDNAYATIWEVQPVSNTMTKARISTSRKNTKTDSYEQDFGGFITFVGTEVAAKAMRLQPRDRVKLIRTEVTNRYVKEKEQTYTNFSVFEFQTADEADRERNGNSRNRTSAAKTQPKESPNEPDAFDSDGDLPF